MKKLFSQTILHCCCGLLLNLSVHGQYNHSANSNWMFSDSLGISFAGGTPGALSSVIAGAGSRESAASVSNSAGELLFYTDGDRVFDRNHNVMPNGDLVQRYNTGQTTFSSVQGALIVPFVNDKNKYHVFSLTITLGWFLLPGNWYYSVVDMSLNSGLGDVVTGYPELLEATTAELIQTEKMIAIAGADCNVWVLRCRHTATSSEYVAYEVNANGFNAIPVSSLSSKDIGLIGEIAISPDGTKLATANMDLFPYSGLWQEGLVLSDFDPATGTVSNSSYLDSNVQYYRACFSPDNTKLYAIVYDGSANTFSLYQFDLSAANPPATKTLIASDNGGALQLAPDGKIYVANLNSDNVAVINAPNLAGTSCMYNISGLNFSNKKVGGNLQNLVVSVFPDLTSFSLDSLICGEEWNIGIDIKAHITDANYFYSWSTGDTLSEITVHTPGIYIVTYGNFCANYVDTFILKGSDVSTLITINDLFELGTTGGPFSSYQWYINGFKIPGATSDRLTINANGDYSVEIADSFGCVYRSEIYKVTNYEIAIDQPESLADVIHIYPNPSENEVYINSPVKVNIEISSLEGRMLVYGQRVNKVDIGHLSKGIYLLRLKDKNGRIIKVEKIVKN